MKTTVTGSGKVEPKKAVEKQVKTLPHPAVPAIEGKVDAIIEVGRKIRERKDLLNDIANLKHHEYTTENPHRGNCVELRDVKGTEYKTNNTDVLEIVRAALVADLTDQVRALEAEIIAFRIESVAQAA